MSYSWSDAACGSEDPDLFHLDDAEGIERAKAVCRRCPAVDACLRDALSSRIEEGILGGLTGLERASLRRAVSRQRLSAEAVAARAAQARQPSPTKPRTIREHVERHAVRIFGGHLGWGGPKRPWIGGKSWTPLQLMFAADRGRQPEGRVVADCAHSGCVKPSHITDEPERREAVARAAA